MLRPCSTGERLMALSGTRARAYPWAPLSAKVWHKCSTSGSYRRGQGARPCLLRALSISKYECLGGTSPLSAQARACAALLLHLLLICLGPSCMLTISYSAPFVCMLLPACHVLEPLPRCLFRCLQPEFAAGCAAVRGQGGRTRVAG